MKRVEDIEYDIHNLQELILDLIWGTEDVGIVLRKPAHTCQAVKLTGLLITINRAELRQAQWQVAI